MGVFGALGGAVKKAVKPVQKAVSKAPGMGALGKTVNKAPGMQPMGRALGLGPSPVMTPRPAPGMSGLAQAGAGIGNAFLQNRPSDQGGMINTGGGPAQATGPMIQLDQPGPMIAQNAPPMMTPDMGPQQATGIGPSPQMTPQMGRRRGYRGQMM